MVRIYMKINKNSFIELVWKNIMKIIVYYKKNTFLALNTPLHK